MKGDDHLDEIKMLIDQGYSALEIAKKIEVISHTHLRKLMRHRSPVYYEKMLATGLRKARHQPPSSDHPMVHVCGGSHERL